MRIFFHAHLTVLAPWLAQPTPADMARIGEALTGADPFTVVLTEVSQFGDGVIYARPEPDLKLRELTARLWAAFPHFPPYGGQFDDAAPHVTLDRRGPGVTRETVASDVAGLLPQELHVDRVDLQWWANHDCHLMHRWWL